MVPVPCPSTVPVPPVLAASLIHCLFPRRARRGDLIGVGRTSHSCQPARCGPVLSAPLLPVAGYNPTLAAALSWNRLPARIYFLTMGKLLWPV